METTHKNVFFARPADIFEYLEATPESRCAVENEEVIVIHAPLAAFVYKTKTAFLSHF